MGQRNERVGGIGQRTNVTDLHMMRLTTKVVNDEFCSFRRFGRSGPWNRRGDRRVTFTRSARASLASLASIIMVGSCASRGVPPSCASRPLVDRREAATARNFLRPRPAARRNQKRGWRRRKKKKRRSTFTAREGRPARADRASPVFSPELPHPAPFFRLLRRRSPCP